MSLTYLPRLTLASRMAILLLILGTLLSSTAYAQTKKKPAPVPPVNKNPGTLGRNQLKGGEGQWGQTYSTTGTFDGWNITFVSAAYSIAPHQGEFPFVVGKDEKFLLIRLRVKNTTSGDRETERFSIPFTVVDAAGNSLDSQSACIRTSDGKPFSMSVKPGFGVDDLVQAIKLKGDVKIVKIVANIGRVGTDEKVIRFMVDDKANKIAPLPAPFADSADPTGATAAPDFAGKIGVAYPLFGMGVTVDGFSFADKFGDEMLPDGKRFLVLTVRLKNLLSDPISLSGTGGYRNGFLVNIIDGDGEDVPQDHTSAYKKATREEPIDESKAIAPGQEYSVRLLAVVPKTGSLTKITIRFEEGGSHGVTYDLSNLK